MAKDVKQSQKTILHVKSGNRCADCKKQLVESGDAKAGGVCAHIYGENPTSARYDSAIDRSFVNSEKNLIYVCTECHDKIDNRRPNEYPPERLFDMKKKHEDAVSMSLQNNIESGKISTYLTKIIVHLGNMKRIPECDSYSRNKLAHEIVDKIDHNNIKIYSELIHEYGIYQTWLHSQNGLYKISTSEGGYEKRNIYNRIRNIYVEILGDFQREGKHLPYDGDQVFQAGYNKIRELVISSKDYVEMNDDELMHCLYIILVDAFIECKWFENPNNGGDSCDSSG